jgi:hypothetical protein
MNTISINWIIKQLWVKKTEGSLSDVVVTANWSCRASDGTFNAVLTGCTEFGPPTRSFTPYPDLKPEQILDWCYANGVDKSAIEANVTAQIQNQINPPVVVLPLPWLPKTEEVSSGDSLPKTTKPLKLRDEQIVDPLNLPTSDVPPSVDGMSPKILG